MRRLAFIAAVVAVIWTPRPAAADVPGTVTLARVGPQTLVLWDCTDRLSSLRDAKTVNSAILLDLEADAAMVLAQTAPRLPKEAKTLTVRAIYRKLGSFNPEYRAVTFAGIERLFTLTSRIPLDEKRANSWPDQLKAGQPPADLELVMTGQLPPQ